MLRSFLPALIASALLTTFAVWLYRSRELPVRGRGLLASLRAGALVLLVLLIWNPTLPAGAGGAAAPPLRVLVDVSRSMTVGEPGATPRDRAEEHLAAARAAGATVESFPGSGGPSDSLARPADESRLAPALRRAAEAGAREVLVLTDLRLEDAVQAAAELERPGVAVTIEDVGGPVRDAGIADVIAPTSGRAGELVDVDIEVFATAGAAGDSATVALERDGSVVATWRVALPAPGATVRRTAGTALPDSAGTVLWSALVTLEGDVFPADDRRTRATLVDPATGVAAFVALAPDWEPRFLLPVLEQVSGLPTRGWLRVGPDRFLPTGGGRPVGSSELRPVLEEARLLVVQGFGADAPDWLLDVVLESRRVVVLARDGDGAEAVGVPTGPVRDGEWYALAPPPPSALARSLADLPAAELPPLGRLLPLVGDPPGPVALTVQRPGQEASQPALVLLEGEARRSVVAVAGGFWRWAFRPGAPRDAYRRLWSGVAGWLLELGEGAALAGVAPEGTVVRAGEPVAWRAPAAASARIEVSLDTAGVAFRVDTVAVDDEGRALQPSLPPAAYGWTVRALPSPADSVTGSDRPWRGTLVAEDWTAELRPPRAELVPPPPEVRVGADARGGAAGLPLRTRTWPWLLLLALISAEWMGRRRSGLR